MLDRHSERKVRLYQRELGYFGPKLFGTTADKAILITMNRRLQLQRLRLLRQWLLRQV